MRIALLNDDALPTARGGASVVVDLLRRELSSRGHEITLITSHQEGDREERRTDGAGPIVSLPISYSRDERHRWVVDQPMVGTRLRSVLSECRPDVVHVHNVHGYLSYGSLAVAREFTHRLFLTAHDTYLISFQRVNSERYLEAALRNEPFRMRFWHHLFGAGRKYWPLRNAAIRRAIRDTGTKVVSISRALEAFLRVNGIASAAVIHNGVPIPPPPPAGIIRSFRERWDLRGPTLLYGGRVNADKGIKALLEAWRLVLSALPSARLVVAGKADGLLAHETSDAFKASFCLPGWMPYSDMPVAYAAADAVTTPSLYLDAFNLMNVEAMAMGKPVVGSVFGGIPEIVEHGETGYTVDPRNSSAFADAIVSLLSNPERAGKMGARGRARATSLFSIEKQADAYLSLFAS